MFTNALRCVISLLCVCCVLFLPPRLVHLWPMSLVVVSLLLVPYFYLSAASYAVLTLLPVMDVNMLD